MLLTEIFPILFRAWFTERLSDTASIFTNSLGASSNFSISSALFGIGDVLQVAWKLLSSPIAVGIYVILVLASIIALIGFLLAEEKNRPDPEMLQEYIERINEIKRQTVRETYIMPYGNPLLRSKKDEKDGEEDEDEEKPKEKKPVYREARFCMLNEIDERMRNRRGIEHYPGASDLSELCDRFRKYCASRLGLYYDVEDIRRFIASLTVTRLIIMQGMSGTGKTSLSAAFGDFLENQSVIVPIQPMWKERSDLLGYFNEFTGRFNETTLLQKMYEANYSKSIYVTVLDEMNIARVEYYFAEFLSLLELPDPNKRYLDVVSDKWDNDPVMLRDGKIKLPDNMWFMGTVNNDDSTFAISDKVYDRAMVMNLDKKCEPFECEDCKPLRVSAAQLEALAREARGKYAISDRNMRRIRKLDEYLIEKFRITFGNRIMKQLTGYVPVYIACGGKETDAIDDMLSKKLFRKLDSQNPVYVKSVAEDVCDFLDQLFGKDALPLCKEYIRRNR